jgi:hypothetical protein
MVPVPVAEGPLNVVITSNTLPVTCGAGLLLPSPAWFAVRLQVPTETIVTMGPLAVQTPGVSEPKVTGRPDVELAVGVNVPPGL